MTVYATPGTLELDHSQLGEFAAWLHREHGLSFPDYQALRRWSIRDIGGFWAAVHDFLQVPWRGGHQQTLADPSMPGARWFPGVHTNIVDSLLANLDPARAAVVTVGEGGEVQTLTGAQFRGQIASLAAALRRLGVQTGDRVVGYLPNIGEAAIAFYAAASLGAIWASVGEDYAPDAALARLEQLSPVVLIAADGYHFGGVARDRRSEVTELHRALRPAHTVIVSRLGLPVDEEFTSFAELVADPDAELEPLAVPFEHPLWVLFSSGTTGVPKGIVHSHGGIQLEMHKMLQLHWDLRPESRVLWATSPSWVIWNILVCVPLVGATAVLYDGSPTFPDPAALWRALATHRITHFGTSPGFLAASERAGIEPGRRFDLTVLRQIVVTGSPLPAAAHTWSSRHVGEHIPLVSVSGGTDVVGAFVGGAPTVPVRPGELSAGCLGVAIEAWNQDGRPVVGEVGELVVTRPMPSMPVAFWADEDYQRYRDAYFSVFDGVWRHGDWITVTEHGSVIIHGRSDSTLNRNGIRMGSADIYHALDEVPEVEEALVIGAELADGGYWMPLFVALVEGGELDDDLTARIRAAIRTGASPRHVPDEVFAVPAIPHTKTGKKLEVPIKRILQGADPDSVVTATAVDRPELLGFYTDLAADRAA